MLLIGAGGIGCELLKNLVCCGFGSQPSAPALQNGAHENGSPKASRTPEIVVIDLDTIDLSNLNRQFLFRKQHIKKPKAFVAKETASQFNPNVHIQAHHASIFDIQYNVEFYASFDLVFNALDNLAARRHVNKMCLAANITLIESGTTGFNGQVQAIRKGVTECYDCNPKPVQKSFPICTIRSTPSQPIHCIVWAKSYLFPELFGSSEEEPTDVAVTEGDNADEVAKLRVEAEALKKIRGMMGQTEFAQHVFDKVFHDDVERLRSMSEMWQSRQPPQGLEFNSLKAAYGDDLAQQGIQVAAQDQAVWTLQENLAVFCSSVEALSKRSRTGESEIEFDKDDKDTLDFVSSAANLRSHVFGIPLHSEWEIKQMAGNIIPAIATSNALTASLCVLEAFKIMRGQVQEQEGLPHMMQSSSGTLGGAKMVFLNSRNTERMILAEALAAPQQSCPVCSPTYAKLVVPASEACTLQQLVDLLREKIGYDDFSIATDAGIIYEPDLDDNLEKTLKSMGISSQSLSFATVVDEGDEPRTDLVLSATSKAAETEDGLRLEPADISLSRKALPAASTQDAPADVERPMPAVLADGGEKRKRGAEDDMEGVPKKVKASSDDIMVIEDDGAILLDD